MPASRRKRATNSAIRRRSGERVICVVPETIFAGWPIESTSTTKSTLLPCICLRRPIPYPWPLPLASEHAARLAGRSSSSRDLRHRGPLPALRRMRQEFGGLFRALMHSERKTRVSQRSARGGHIPCLESPGLWNRWLARQRRMPHGPRAAARRVIHFRRCLYDTKVRGVVFEADR
jgi:hypothetical protein